MKRDIIFGLKIFSLILGVAIASFVSISFLSVNEPDTLTNESIPRAAILDQLSDDIPNESLQELATKYLIEAGYEVDIFTTKDITVDFYKQLPSMNYQFVIVRSHGVQDDDENPLLFTGERYTEDKYITEQLFGNVKKATPLFEASFKPDLANAEWVVLNATTKILRTPAQFTDQTQNQYFAIGPKFVRESMVGKFSGTTFLLAGCNTLSNSELAESFVSRGASVVVGWDNTVGSSDNDRGILYVLHKTIEDDLELKEAVNQINDILIPELMPFPANLEFYSKANI